MGKEENVGNQHFLLFLKCFIMLLTQGHQNSRLCGRFNTLPNMPILGSYNSAANKDMMS